MKQFKDIKEFATRCCRHRPDYAGSSGALTYIQIGGNPFFIHNNYLHNAVSNHASWVSLTKDCIHCKESLRVITRKHCKNGFDQWTQ